LPMSSMIPRGSACHATHHFQCCFGRLFVGSALAAVALTLHGCSLPSQGGDAKGLNRGKDTASADDFSDAGSGVSGPATLRSPGIEMDFHDMSFCDGIVNRNSKAFTDQAAEEGAVYYEALVKTFSVDFVRYPFCLENSHLMVHKVAEEMRGQRKARDLPIEEFREDLNRTLKEQYDSHASIWQHDLESWTARNKEHQLQNLGMVRQVLGIHDQESDELLSSQITAFWNDKPWWTFFKSVAEKGCVRRYTQRCSKKTQEARRLANDLILQTMGHPLHWHAFEDLPEPNEDSHEILDDHKDDGGNATSQRDQSSSSDSESESTGGSPRANASEIHSPSFPGRSHTKAFLQKAEQTRRYQVPVELMPGGQQVRPRRKHRS